MAVQQSDQVIVRTKLRNGSNTSSEEIERIRESFSTVSIATDQSGPSSAYDVRVETMPDEPFFHPTFQATLKRGIVLAHDVAHSLEKCKLASEPQSDLSRLLKDAKDLSHFQSSDTRTIAILGDSGEGKSSLVNSLLNCPGIAKTGDIGTACTSAVTEYRQKTRNHTAPITIEVEHLSRPQIDELIKELVWSYLKFKLPDVAAISSAEEYKQYRSDSEIALSTLEAAFGHKRELDELMRDEGEGALERITSRLLDWTEGLGLPEGDGTVWKSSVQTAEECCDITAEFMGDRLWPFTKVIRVYLDAQVLKTGIVLADLPGLHDTNLARVKAAEDYLLKCDHIFIVAKIARAITDQSLQSSIYSILKQHIPLEWESSTGKYLNLAVVCTRSEEIKVKTHRKDFCGPGKRISEAVMDELDREIQQAKSANNRSLKKAVKLKQELLLIEARNARVKGGLQRAYAAKVPGGNLGVFCVSNSAYEKFSRKGITEHVNASGIPELRSFCYSIAANAQFLEAKHFLQSSLSSLVNSVKSWVENSQGRSGAASHQEREELLKAHNDLYTKVATVISDIKISAAETFEEQLLLLMANRNESWEQAAKAQSSRWTGWHWTQYNAWCINNGTHATRGRPLTRWNAELIWKRRQEEDFAWSLIEEEIPEYFERLEKLFREEMLKMNTIANQHGDAPTFSQGIVLRIEALKYIFSLIQRDFLKEFTAIRRNASDDNYNSYILREMLPSYRSASQEYGTGKMARQHEIIRRRIADGNLFPNISFCIQNDMTALIDRIFKNVQKKVQGVLNLIRADLERTFIPKATVENGAMRELVSRVAYLEEELEDMLKGIPLPSV